MTANTPQDSQLKIGIVDDVITIINSQGVLKGDEEVIGGFDLIFKNTEITLPNSSTYSTMLGCKPNRLENMKKLARSCAYRLGKQYIQNQAAKIKNEKPKPNHNRFNLKKN